MMYSEKEFIFGMHPIMEAIKGGKQIDRILIRQGLRGELYHELMKLVNEKGVPWQVVPQEKLDYITRKNHQGSHRMALSDRVSGYRESGSSYL